LFQDRGSGSYLDIATDAAYAVTVIQYLIAMTTIIATITTIIITTTVMMTITTNATNTVAIIMNITTTLTTSVTMSVTTVFIIPHTTTQTTIPTTLSDLRGIHETFNQLCFQGRLWLYLVRKRLAMFSIAMKHKTGAHVELLFAVWARVQGVLVVGLAMKLEGAQAVESLGTVLTLEGFGVSVRGQVLFQVVRPTSSVTKNEEHLFKVLVACLICS
jgi:hypothetical protein